MEHQEPEVQEGITPEESGVGEVPKVKQARVEKKRPKKRKVFKPMSPGMTVFSLICGCLVFIMTWSTIIGHLIGGASAAAYEPAGDTIDVLYVEGTIAEGETGYNHVWTLHEIDSLIKSDTNQAIMLYVNSPGGGVYESDEIYLKLQEYKEKTGRPVYAYMAQTAASGGLYICMAADKIYANRMTMTGSIGVIMSTVDTTGLQDLIGIKTENITSGPNKAMGNPLTAEQRDILQAMVNETYNIFVNIVAESRGLDLETTKEIADGRVYSALQAKSLGLIDEVGLVDEALDDLQETYGLGACEVYSRTAPTSIWDDVLGSMMNSKWSFGEFQSINHYIEKSKSSKLMYYYNGL